MEGFPPQNIQRMMFVMPYGFVFLTGVALVVVQRTVPGRVVGAVNLAFLFGYAAGVVGNHYMKTLSFFFNLIVLLPLFVMSDYRALLLMTTSYWLPAVAYVLLSIEVPSITEILPKQLYIGNAKSASSRYWPRKYGVTDILDLTGRTKHGLARKVRIKKLRVEDTIGSKGSLAAVSDEAIEFMKSSISEGGTVLVHCQVGHSRSAAIIAQYLMEVEGLRLDEAYNYIRERRPVVDVSSDHMESLRKLDRGLSKSR